MLRTNAETLVAMAVEGQVTQPTLRAPGFIPDNEGRAVILPGMSGVVYNVACGDPAFGWAADHVEPGVSIAHPDEKADHALHYLTCIGNAATVTSGLAAGAAGIVTGEHARMLVHVGGEAADLLSVGDRIQITALGRGLRLLDYPWIELKKMSPRLLEALRIRPLDERRIEIPVAMELPVRIMASGAELNAEFVDQDFASGDRKLMAELGIDKLRLGDIVAIDHADHRFGRSYRRGASAIGLCIHGDSVMTGHGPGILTLMTSAEPAITWRIDPTANIAAALGIGGQA